jgi:hypothetical protein
MLKSVALAAVLTGISALPGVCDIFHKGGTPCVAAHSMTRALFQDYSGPLFDLLKRPENTTKTIFVKCAGGIADTAAQQAFCGNSLCIVQRIYDQSSSGNHLGIEKGFSWLNPPRNGQDEGVNLTNSRARVLLGGQPVFSAVFDPTCDEHSSSCDGKFGYSNRTARNTAVGDEPQTVYALFDGTHFNSGCCFDYGNAEKDHGKGTMAAAHMEAIYFGCNDLGPPLPACSTGPYVMADMESMHAMMKKDLEPTYLQPGDFLAAIVKGKPGHLAIKAGDVQKAHSSFRTIYEGVRPEGYEVMKKEGGIVLGVGGDNSPWGSGTFYEGVMTRGFSSNETDAAVLANVIAAGYSR